MLPALGAAPRLVAANLGFNALTAGAAGEQLASCVAVAPNLEARATHTPRRAAPHRNFDMRCLLLRLCPSSFVEFFSVFGSPAVAARSHYSDPRLPTYPPTRPAYPPRLPTAQTHNGPTDRWWTSAAVRWTTPPSPSWPKPSSSRGVASECW